MVGEFNARKAFGHSGSSTLIGVRVRGSGGVKGGFSAIYKYNISRIWLV